MIVTYLFILLSALFVIESTTVLARKEGYRKNMPEAGLILQSSLSLLSRIVIFMFMPLLGYAADQKILSMNLIELIFVYSIVPVSLFLTLIFKEKISLVYGVLIDRLKVHGSFFRRVDLEISPEVKKVKVKRRIKVLYKFYLLVILTYIPFYMAWPVVVFLLDAFHDNRGMILGLSSVFNGINTIIITMYIDPKLIKIGMNKRLIYSVYDDLLKMRFYSSLVVFMILLLLMIYELISF